MKYQQPFITLVDQILSAKSPHPLQGGVTEGRGGFIGQPPRQTSSATPPYHGGEQIKAVDTSALERQIDDMVYALYGLTSEEIAIVEDGGPNFKL